MYLQAHAWVGMRHSRLLHANAWAILECPASMHAGPANLATFGAMSNKRVVEAMFNMNRLLMLDVIARHLKTRGCQQVVNEHLSKVRSGRVLLISYRCLYGHHT